MGLVIRPPLSGGVWRRAVVRLGDIDEAFLWLERAIDAPDRMIEPIKTWPILDPFRGDPRFAALLRKMNLEP